MTFVRSLLLASVATLACGLIPQAAFATDGMTPINISKECNEYSGEMPSFCTVTQSSLDLIPAGTKIHYYGPMNASPLFSSASVVIAVGPGDAAVGHCIVYDHASPPHGLCAFHAGSGALMGFQGIFDVSVDDQSIWHWDGEYVLAPTQ